MKKTAAMIVLAAGVMTAGAAVQAEMPEGTYSITYNLNEGNTEDMPEYQFLSGAMRGMVNNDSRIYVQIDLTLDGEDAYELTADCYVVEGGKTAEVGDETGIGLKMTTTAEGTYVDNGDDTVTINTPEHVHHDMATDTYSILMKDACGMNVLGNTEDGEYDSDDLPEMVTMVPETIFTLDEEGGIVTYAYLHPEEYETEAETEAAAEGASSETGAELLVITSDDGQTTFTLYDNGTYEFYFESYDVKDNGTYVYDADAATLTITDANGKATEAAADGGTVKFHYEYSESSQLAGDFTADAAELEKTVQ